MNRNLPGISINRRMKTAVSTYGLLLFLAPTLFVVPLCAEGLSWQDKPAPVSASAAGRTGSARADSAYTLSGTIQYALRHNPYLRRAGRDIEAESYGIDTAKAERMPKIDFGGGLTRYRYDTPLTPVVIQPPIGSATDFPEYRKTVWNTGVSFRLPLFRGGRLYRGVHVAEMKKAVAQDNYKTSRQDLIYNISSVYYKIVQFEKLLLANDASVKQLETHKKNIELSLKTGTVPKLDLLKTDVELAHAVENRLLVKNNLASTYELLKTLMGMDDMSVDIAVTPETATDNPYPDLEESLNRAFSHRPDYKAVAKKRLIGEERVKIAQGKRLPDIFAVGDYGGLAGTDTGLKENYYYGVRLTVPILDGGLIASEVNKERVELEKIKEEERSIRLAITREVRDAHLNIANALERIEVAQKAIESARENLRVELLKYGTGAGTSQDVIDAQTALLRTETDYHQAVFDRETAIAYLKKAVGEDGYGGEEGK